MNKKGFTLVELLAAIALIAILSILIIPNVVKTYDKSNKKAMLLQETETLDAAKLFVEDFCHNPISSKHRELCNRYEKTSGSNTVYYCINNLQDRISISGFESDPYIREINYTGGVPCDGIVTFKKNGNSYGEGKTYLVCKNPEDNEYSYTTDGYNGFSSELNECLSPEFKLGYTGPSLNDKYIYTISSTTLTIGQPLPDNFNDYYNSYQRNYR